MQLQADETFRHARVVRTHETLFDQREQTGADPCGRIVAVALTPGNMSRAALSPLLRGLDDPAVRVVPSASPALKLLLASAQGLESVAPSSPELRAAASSHLVELVALAIGSPREVNEETRRSVRAARLAAVKRDIHENAWRANYSVASVARRHGVTPRYIHLLFESEGKTFTEFVHDRRLKEAYRILTRPHHASLRIADVAFAAGFSDVSTFNRLFKRQYGATPSELRRTALEGTASACPSSSED